MPTPRQTIYTALSGAAIYAGIAPPVTPLVWEQLTVAAHSRKVIRTSSPGDSATYSALAAGAQASVESLSPETVSAVPLRGYNILVRGEDGALHISGSLHSGYRGCEIDRLVIPTDASTVIATSISHQPTAPPQGPNSGYASGLGGHIYKQSHAAESVTGMEDQTSALDWKPFIGHDWTMSSHTPTTGFCTMVAHPVQTGQTAGQPYWTGTFSIVGGVLQSSHTQPSDNYASGARLIGLVGFDRATGRFKTWLSQLSPEITSLPGGGWPFTDTAYGLGTSGLSDFNPNDGSVLLFNYTSSASSMSIIKYVPSTHTVTVLANGGAGTGISAAGIAAGGSGHEKNGWLIRHLEADKYLMLACDGPGGWASTLTVLLYAESFGSGNARIQNLTSSLPGSGTGQPFNGVGATAEPLSFSVDKARRLVFWFVIPSAAPIRVYVSSFDSLMTWTPVATSSTPQVTNAGSWLTLNRQPMHYLNGFLVFHHDAIGPNDPGYHAGAMNLKRVYLGT